jgi:hypothetical protein
MDEAFTTSPALQAAQEASELTAEHTSDQSDQSNWPIRIDMEAGGRKIRSVRRIEAAVGQKPWEWLTGMHVRD